MIGERIDKADLLASLPNEWAGDLQTEIEHQLEASGRKVVVLDDDPTGTQTVHGVSVLTAWSTDVLCAELLERGSMFFVLTNSRSLSPSAARALNLEIGQNLSEAGRQSGRSFVVVSRSDSTLRGHFPSEMEALSASLQQKFDAWLLVPFFQESGRYTINDTHYVLEGDDLIPASETEFAKDRVFGYQESNLPRWVEEKSGGRISSDNVASISLEEIRVGGPKRVADRLHNLWPGSTCVVNAASYRDLEVLTHAVLTTEAKGKRFLYRTAASFVRVRAAIRSRPLLTQSDLDLPSSGGGLVMVGSHVNKSTQQVESLRRITGLVSIEVCVDALLDQKLCCAEVERVTSEIDLALRDSQDVVAYTSRQLVTCSSDLDDLAIAEGVSSGLVRILRGLSTRPRYILAKGGITSSTLATAALNVQRCEVLGQIAPGVPVWKLRAESRHPGLTYIVFPGNVGEADALADVVTKLR